MRRNSRVLSSKAVAEAVGTFAVVFAGCGAIRVNSVYPGSIPLALVPVIFGLAVAAMIYAVGHISGAHFNPAVTLAFAVVRHFPPREVFAYWAAQFLGAGLAVLLLALLLPGGNTFGTTLPQVAVLQSLGWESVLTFFLMFVIIAVATDTRAVGTMAGAAIGATVMFAAFVGGPVTGASMNPARTLAPAIAEGRFDHLWVYVVGPCLGAVVAAFLYEWIRCDESDAGSGNPSAAKGCC